MPFTAELGATVEGYFFLYSGFGITDGTRPLRWQVNPDGVVNLYGWVRWVDINTGVALNELRTFGGTALTDSTANPPGWRDMVGASSFGPMHYAVDPNGKLYFRPTDGALTLIQNNSWFSFDGVSWRNYAPGS